MRDKGLLCAVGVSIVVHCLVLALGSGLPAPASAPHLIEARLLPRQLPEAPVVVAPAQAQPPASHPALHPVPPERPRPARVPPRSEAEPPPRLLASRGDPVAPSLPVASGPPVATAHKPDAVPAAVASPASTSGVGQPAAAPSYSPPSFGARYLDNPKPAYPMLARRRGLEGTVRLEVRVSVEGIPTAVKVRESAGHEALDEAAMTAVWHWRFVPARRGGDAVEGVVVVPIRFRLGDDEAA